MHGVKVEFANVLVLNKTDLVSAEQLEQLKALLRKLNTTAKVRMSGCCVAHGGTGSMGRTGTAQGAAAQAQHHCKGAHERVLWCAWGDA